MVIITAFTLTGVSNISVSAKETSERVLFFQHIVSSKLEPSLLVRTFTSPGPYAQSTLTPLANRRASKTPVQVTLWPGVWLPLEHLASKIERLKNSKQQPKRLPRVLPVTRTSTQRLLSCEGRGTFQIACRISAARARSVESDILLAPSRHRHKQSKQ